MRLLLAASTLLALSAFHAPAAAETNIYGYCKSASDDCNYATYEQCVAAVSGSAGDCTANPAFPTEASLQQPKTTKHHRRRHLAQHG